MTKEEVIEIGDSRWRKIDDCEEISDGIDTDVRTSKTDIAIIKVMVKGILWGVGLIGAAAITAWGKYMFGG